MDAEAVTSSANGISKLKLTAADRSDSRADSACSGENGTYLFSPSGSSPGTTQRGASRRHRSEPFLIGVAGGTASGKTTVCDHLLQRLHGEA